MEYDYENAIAEAIAFLLDNERVDEFNSSAGWFSASNEGYGTVKVTTTDENGLSREFDVWITDKTHYGF